MSDRDNDLVLHLKLDDIDIATNSVPDSSASEARATVHGASLVADDAFGACLHFDEPEDHLEVREVGLSGASPAHTIEAWIALSEYPQTRSWILLLGPEGAGSHCWVLKAEGASDPLAKRLQLGLWEDPAQQVTAAVPLGEWVHIATTYDGRDLVSYVNGMPIDAPRPATVKLATKQLTLAKRAIAAEKNFQGKIAGVRIYKRALSVLEIREDMSADRLALPAYRKAHPIAFSLCDEDENYVLYIDDDLNDENRLNLELRNSSAETIVLAKRNGDRASRENHHLELVFRNGVLSEGTLTKLREGEIGLAPDLWDLFSPGEDGQSGTVSVYFLCKEVNKLFLPGQRLKIPLRHMSANAGNGARGTRIELKLNQFQYRDDPARITGSRIQHIQIMNHLGSRRPPLHVGFVGSNRILNDGASANRLVLQLMNVPKPDQDTAVKLTKDSKFFISFDVQSVNEDAPWALCTDEEIKELKANESIIIAQLDANGDVVTDPKGNPVSDVGRWTVQRTDRGTGESPLWSLSPRQEIILGRGDYIQIHVANIKSSLPSGLTNLYLEYRNIAGFWDGQVVCAIEKAPLLFCDVRNQHGKHTGELRVGIGSADPGAKLEVALTPKDSQTKPLVIRKDNASYLTILHNGNVGIGKADPAVSLDVDGEIRAGFFRAGQGSSRRLPVGKQPIGRGTEAGIVWDEDIYWYRIARIAAPKPLTPAGAEFSLRAAIAGRTVQVAVFRIVGFSSASPLRRNNLPTTLTILSNTMGSFVFTKLRVLVPEKAVAECEGYLEVFARQAMDGETDVSLSIYDNLDGSSWQPIAWEKQPSEVSSPLVAFEYPLDRVFAVVAQHERFAVDSKGDVLINGKVAVNTSASGGSLAVHGGLHVGSGDADPGDKNLLVDGSMTVMGHGILFGSLTARNSIGLLHLQTQNLAAEIAVEPALIFKTQHDGKWSNSVTIHSPGGDTPTLTVAGNVSEKLDLIEVKGRTDWTAPDHPIMKYFSKRLTGKPAGTMLRAIADLREWWGHYWQGWVDAGGNIRVIHNSINTTHVAPKSTD